MEVNGKKISERIINSLKQKQTPKKFMAVVLFGKNEASFGFVEKKKNIAEELGVDFRIYNFTGDYNNDRARKEVLDISNHKTCGGVIVQLPLPEGLNKYYIANVIKREKDVDVIGERALGAFYSGRNLVLPPAAAVTKTILEELEIYENLGNKKAAVVGAGFLTGKPIAVWLASKAREIFILDKGTDLKMLKEVDLVISGTGEAGLIKDKMLKKGSVVIDFGYGKDKKGNLSGDFEAVKVKKAKYYTPTPGGTGPILVAQIFNNFYKLNR